MSLIRTDVVLGKQQNVVGSSDKDLVLQTKGKVKIQQNSKFIDLIKDGKLNIPEIIEKYKSKSDFPNKTGFYYSEEDNLIYAVIDGNIIPINGEGGISELPDFIKKLDDLEDVIISNPSDGQYLTFKNGYWINGKLEYDKDDIKDIVDGVVDDVINDVENKINYTYRGYKDIKETINMMFDPSGDYFTEFIRPIAIETAYIAVATESQQFNLFDIIFRPNKNGEEYNKNFWSWKTITGKEFGYLQHNTINKTWQIYSDLEHASNSFNGAAVSSPKEFYIAHDLSKLTLDGNIIPEDKLNTTPFYVYARCNKEVLDDATFVVSTSQMTVTNDSDPNYYWFWVGVINSVTGEGDDAYRSFNCNFGFTEISGQYITTGVIKDPTGGSYWDMEHGEFRLQYYIGLDDSGNPIYYPGIEFRPIRDSEGNVIDVELKVYGEIDAFSGTIGGIGIDNNHLYSISGNYGTMIYLNKDNKWDTIKYAPTKEGIEIQIPKYQRVYNQDEQKYTFEPILNEEGEQVYDTLLWKGESEVFTSVDKYIEDVKNYIINNTELFPADSSAYLWANDFENSDIGKGTHVPMFTNKGLVISQDGDIIGPDYFLTSDASKRPSFFRGNLIIVDENGNDVSLKQYIINVGSYFDWIHEDGKNYIIPSLYYGEDLSIHSRGDIVAYSTENYLGEYLPVAADYDTTGLFRAKNNGGLLYDNEGWYVDPEFQGGGGGIDEEQLKQYLITNKYITSTYLDEQGYVKFSSTLKGYKKANAYTPISESDTLLTAFGKLERNFDNYVDLTTNQTIGGVKTFNETLLSKKDIIAYADGGEYASGLPVADQYTYGLVKVDGTTVRINASGQLEADAGGGIDFTVGTGLQLSGDSVLSVKYGTTAGTACQGDDSRLHTHNNKSILDGITSGLISNWNTAYTNNHTHSNKTVLDGISSTKVSHWDTAYTNNHTHSNKSYLDVINQNLSNTSSPNFKNLTVDINIVAEEDIYANNNMYTQTLQAYTAVNTKNVTASGYVKAQGDVIAYADGGEYASGLPVADTYTYGLIKYDGTTIGKNSSGQLYVINAGSGGGSTVSWGSETQYHTAPLTVNGVSKTVTLSGHTHEWDTAITNKPAWLNRDTKPSYTWDEISGKPSIISSITYYTYGSGNVVTGVTASGNTVYVTKGSISGGSDWDGGTVYNDISIRKTNGTLRLYSGSNNWALWCDGSSNYNFRANYNSTEMFAINTSGGWWFKGSQQSSDLRKKDIVGYVQDVLDKMIHISVIRFRWNDNPYDDGSVHIGLGAQTVKPYFPDAVGIWDDSLTIDYSAMGCIAFQGVKELYTRIKPIETEIQILRNQVLNLQQRLDTAYREIFLLKQTTN